MSILTGKLKTSKINISPKIVTTLPIGSIKLENGNFIAGGELCIYSDGSSVITNAKYVGRNGENLFDDIRKGENE